MKSPRTRNPMASKSASYTFLHKNTHESKKSEGNGQQAHGSVKINEIYHRGISENRISRYATKAGAGARFEIPVKKGVGRKSREKGRKRPQTRNALKFG